MNNLSTSEIRKRNITLTLGELFDILFDGGEKSHTSINVTTLNKIFQIDTEYDLFFPSSVMGHSVRLSEMPVKTLPIWSKQAWLDNGAKLEEQRRKDEEQRKWWNLTTEAVQCLAKQIITYSGVDIKTAEIFARALLSKKDKKKLLLFNFDINDEKWKGLF